VAFFVPFQFLLWFIIFCKGLITTFYKQNIRYQADILFIEGGDELLIKAL